MEQKRSPDCVHHHTAECNGVCCTNLAILGIGNEHPTTENVQYAAAPSITPQLQSTPLEALIREAHLPTMARRYRMLAAIQADRWNNLEDEDVRKKLHLTNGQHRLKRSDWRSKVTPAMESRFLSPGYPVSAAYRTMISPTRKQKQYRWLNNLQTQTSANHSSGEKMVSHLPTHASSNCTRRRSTKPKRASCPSKTDPTSSKEITHLKSSYLMNEFYPINLLNLRNIRRKRVIHVVKQSDKYHLLSPTLQWSKVDNQHFLYSRALEQRTCDIRSRPPTKIKYKIIFTLN